jgi:hypothetical protein
MGCHPISLQGEFAQYSNCGTTFNFSAEEQGFFQSKGYTGEPMRCSSESDRVDYRSFDEF